MGLGCGEGSEFGDGKMIRGEDGKVDDYGMGDLNGGGWG